MDLSTAIYDAWHWTVGQIEAALLRGLVRTYDGTAPRPSGMVAWWFEDAPTPRWETCDGEDLQPGDRWIALPDAPEPERDTALGEPERDTALGE